VSSTSANRISALLYGGDLQRDDRRTAVRRRAGHAAGIMAVAGAALSWCNAAAKGIHINLFWTGLITCSSR
jgi:hypothetical protein